ncbi:Muconate cycloisomerase 1 [Hypsizygus marmoreus]|uniref:Muconate cycloisomerase 1 n=1 Tax=Hypsizygus marmoreus TaxID=39966 RepID=A0A369K1Z9_HYPMA|nr:Muconate cycloisomerase 1 [Hypsizygus marmoreus]
MPNTTTVAGASPTVHHILSGSFRSLSLFLLAFSPLNRTLSLVQKVDAFGPHQYLATNPRKDRVYTTSWALPPVLSSWEIERPDGGARRVNHINSVPITATSSYITIPPPFTHAYSAGGPTGEVHIIDPATGGFGAKLQQIVFVPEDELETADKTRVALRYGSHAVEFSPATGHAFIPVLGTDSIEMYTRDIRTGLLSHIYTSPSPRGPNAHDGPRHVKIHPNGKILYSVTEHTNFVDAYTITPTSLTYVASRSLLPANTLNMSQFRGDTLLLTPATPHKPTPLALFATTRGATTSDKGWLSVFSLDADGLFADTEEHHETSTSGGKAHALDLLPKSEEGSASPSSDSVWILLTDDDDSTTSPAGGNGVRVLEWNGWGKGLSEVAGWPAPGTSKEQWMAGGSHAIWLD